MSSLFPYHDADMGQTVSWPHCYFMPFCLLLYRLTVSKDILEIAHPDRALVHLGLARNKWYLTVLGCRSLLTF